MHILLIHQAFVALDEPGGTRHHELARCLAARGHQVTVIASTVSYLTGKADAASTSSEEVDGGRVTVLRARTYSALHRSFLHRVLSFFSFMASSFLLGVKVPQVDLVWGTSPPIFQGVTAWLLARLKHAPFLFEVRDLWPAFAIQVGVLRNPFLIRLSQWLEGFLYRRADRVMVNSPGFVVHVQGGGARRVELVPNGVDTQMFDPYANGIAFRQNHGLEGRFVALYAGAHGLSNDLFVVLQAAQQLLDQPKISIVLLGDGKEKLALMARAAELGLTNLHFIPPVPKAGMAEALAAADACIAILKPIPLYATVYPNKVFDYMAAGRPVILAINGVIRQVVEQADGGLFTPPGDAAALAQAILRLKDDPQWARQKGLNARAYVEAHFDRTALADHLVEIVEQMGRK
jgi:glycosyltransferase involved in cell wall biosynthesis